MKSIFKIVLSLFICSAAFVACDDDDDSTSTNSNPITINAVYLQDADSDVPNRKVDFVRLGQLLRIEGSGFAGINRIYINGYSCYFNPVMLSDNNVWVSVNKNVPITDAADDVRNTIVISKASGVSTKYDISVRSSAPSITSVDKTLPNKGELVTCFGSGLIEVSKVVLPGNVEITENIICDDEDGEWFAFVMPEGVTESGSIFMECANGGAYSPSYFNYSKGMILDFDGVGTQGYWSWSATGSMISPAEDADGQTVDPLNTGRNNCVCLTPDRLKPLPVKSRLAEAYTAGNDNDPDWATAFGIDAETSVADLALQFDIYVPKATPWSGGFLGVYLANNFSSPWADQYNYNVIPWLNSDATITPYFTADAEGNESWITITVPMIKLNTVKDADDPLSVTLADIAKFRASASYCNFGMIYSNADFTMGKFLGTDSDVEIPASEIADLNIYLDNWRIVPTTTPVYDEFAGAEE